MFTALFWSDVASKNPVLNLPIKGGPKEPMGGKCHGVVNSRVRDELGVVKLMVKSGSDGGWDESSVGKTVAAFLTMSSISQVKQPQLAL